MKNHHLYIGCIYLVTALNMFACNEEDINGDCICETGENCTDEEKNACQHDKTCICETGENCTDEEKDACQTDKDCICETGENCTDEEKNACQTDKDCICETGENCSDIESAACTLPEHHCDCTTGNNCTETEIAACEPGTDCSCETWSGCTVGNISECAQQSPCNCQTGLNCTDAEKKACTDSAVKCDPEHSNIFECRDNVLIYCDRGTGYAENCGDDLCSFRGCTPVPCKGKCKDKEYCDLASNTCMPFQCSPDSKPTCSEDGTKAFSCGNGQILTTDCHIEVPGLNYTTQYAFCVDGECQECAQDGYYCNGRVSYNCENHTLYETMCENNCDEATGQCGKCSDDTVWVETYQSPFVLCAAYNACAYPIRNVQDLMNIEEGKDYVLMNDITITKEDHYKAPNLTGRFMGSDHTITYHLEFDEYNADNHDSDPYLFNDVTHSEITSLKLNASFKANRYHINDNEPKLGALAKKVLVSNLFNIDANINYDINIEADDDIIKLSSMHIGGLVAYAYIPVFHYDISNINVTGSIKLTNDIDKNGCDIFHLFVGGCFGEYGGIFIHNIASSVDIDISSKTESSNIYAGGVIGWAEGFKVTYAELSSLTPIHHINSLSDISIVTNTHTSVGGVIGANLYSNLEHIYYKGNLNINTYASKLNKKIFIESGGIAGSLAAVNINNIYSEPNFTLNHTSSELYVDTIGGIAGYIQTGPIVTLYDPSTLLGHTSLESKISECTSNNTLNINIKYDENDYSSESAVRFGGITAKDYAILTQSSTFKDVAARNHYNLNSLLKDSAENINTKISLYGIIGEVVSTLDRVFTMNSRNKDEDSASTQAKTAKLDALIHKNSIGGKNHSNLCYYLDTADSQISSLQSSQGEGTKYQPSQIDAIVETLNQDAEKQGDKLLDGWTHPADSDFIIPNKSDKNITGYAEITQACSK